MMRGLRVAFLHECEMLTSGKLLFSCGVFRSLVKRGSMPEPILSPEAWEAVKAASIKGVPDSQLAESFGINSNAIRQRRFLDPIWKAAVNAKREAVEETKQESAVVSSGLTGGITKGAVLPPVASLAAKVASTVQESIATLGESNRLLALQIAAKGLRQADSAPPDVQSWGDVKALVEIVHKASGMESGNAVQVNVLNSGEFDFIPASVEIMEIT